MKEFMIVLDDQIAYSNSLTLYFIREENEELAKQKAVETINKEKGLDLVLSSGKYPHELYLWHKNTLENYPNASLEYSVYRFYIYELEFNTGREFETWYVGE